MSVRAGLVAAAMEDLRDRLERAQRPLDPEARDVLYANLWDLYGDDTYPAPYTPGDPSPARLGEGAP